MMPINKLYLDNFWDIEKALIMQNIFDILPVFNWLLFLKSLHVFVFILQLLQP